MRASEWRSVVGGDAGTRGEEALGGGRAGEEKDEGVSRKSEILDGLGSNSRRGRAMGARLGVVAGEREEDRSGPSADGRMVWSERMEGLGLGGTPSLLRSVRS